MGSQTKLYLEILLRFLSDESISKKRQVLNTEGWSLIICDEKNTPQQRNNDDCGVFVTMFADFILDGISLMNFSQSDIPHFRKRMCLHINEGKLSYHI